MTKSKGLEPNKKERQFPQDADGDVLQMLLERGVNLSSSREIDFYCFAKDRDTANKIKKEVVLPGFSNKISKDPAEEIPDKIFSVYFCCNMVPDYDAIIKVQDLLNKQLKKFETYCDGWGTWSG